MPPCQAAIRAPQRPTPLSVRTDHGRQQGLVDVLAEHGRRLDDRPLGRTQRGQQGPHHHRDIAGGAPVPDRGDQQRQSAGAPFHLGRGVRPDQVGHLGHRERSQGDGRRAVAGQFGQPHRDLLRGGRPHACRRRVTPLGPGRGDLGQQVERGGVGPVQVLQHHDERAGGQQRVTHRGQRGEPGRRAPPPAPPRGRGPGRWPARRSAARHGHSGGAGSAGQYPRTASTLSVAPQRLIDQRGLADPGRPGHDEDRRRPAGPATRCSARAAISRSRPTNTARGDTTDTGLSIPYRESVPVRMATGRAAATLGA